MEVAPFSVTSVHIHFVFSFKKLVQKTAVHGPECLTLPRGNLPFFGWSGVFNLRESVNLGQTSAVPT